MAHWFRFVRKICLSVLAFNAKQPATPGAIFEDQARVYLEARGLILVARNFRSSCGEIDLIMRDADCLVFVEVRARSNQYYGGALASLTPSKQRRLWRTATKYLEKRPHAGAVRFDFIAIAPEGVDWLVDVFQEERFYVS